jgi:hypothetical protein
MLNDLSCVPAGLDAPVVGGPLAEPEGGDHRVQPWQGRDTSTVTNWVSLLKR